jgi:hypothetical protein
MLLVVCKMNVFDKPNEQNEDRFNSAMARKGRIKFNFFIAKVTKKVDFTNAIDTHFFYLLRCTQASI